MAGLQDLASCDLSDAAFSRETLSRRTSEVILKGDRITLSVKDPGTVRRWKRGMRTAPVGFATQDEAFGSVYASVENFSVPDMRWIGTAIAVFPVEFGGSHS